MILILTILTIILFVIITIYYINTLQKKADSITTQKLEHMADINGDSQSNLPLILSKNYKQQFVQEGIKNINRTKVIENGVIKFKEPPKTDYEKTREQMDSSSLDVFFDSISKSLMPYKASKQYIPSIANNPNIEHISLQNLDKFFQLVLKAKKKIYKYKNNYKDSGQPIADNTGTTSANTGTTSANTGTTSANTGTTSANPVSTDPNTTSVIIKGSEEDIKVKELEIQKMIDDVLTELNKDRGKTPPANGDTDITSLISIDKDKIMAYLKNLTDEQIGDIDLEPYEYKSKDDKKEDWKIENSKEFEYIEDPEYPNEEDEEYYKRNTDEYNREQQDHYDRISLLNDIELSKQKWLNNNTCKKLLEEPYLTDFKKAYHNYMIYAFTNVLKYLPAIEIPTELTVIELKAYKQILQKMPNCEHLMNMFFDNIIDSLNCNNKKKDSNNGINSATTVSNTKKYKIELDKNSVNSKNTTTNSNIPNSTNHVNHINHNITTTKGNNSTTTQSGSHIKYSTTTNSNNTTATTTTKNAFNNGNSGIPTNNIGTDDAFNFDANINQVVSTDFQPFDPLTGQCPVTYTLKNMKPLKILK